jgi:hypothetical protein
MEQPSKPIKRVLRRLAAAAYEEELRQALVPLHAAFEEWARGELSSGDVSDAIDQFHQGPARELFARYNAGLLEAAVAHAIVAGFIDRAVVPPEVLSHLGRAITLYESQREAS